KIDVFSNGDVLFACRYEDSVDVSFNGSANWEEVNYKTTVPEALLVGKYDSSGNYLWHRNLDCPKANYANNVNIDSKDNFWIAGNVRDSLNINPAGSPYWLHAIAGNYLYLAQFNKNGMVNFGF